MLNLGNAVRGRYQSSKTYGSGLEMEPLKLFFTLFYAFLCICLTSSGRRLNAATLRSQRRCSKAGDPLITLPGATSPGTPDCAVTTTPSPMKLWPTTPTCPASRTFLPTPEEPASPTCAQSRVFSPTLDPCPTCTRLSILTPLAISVLPTLARSIQELA